MSCPFPALRHLGKATSFHVIYKTPAMIVGVFLCQMGLGRFRCVRVVLQKKRARQILCAQYCLKVRGGTTIDQWQGSPSQSPQ